MLQGSVSKFFLFAIIICALGSSCSTAKYIPPGEKLFTGADVNIEGPANKKTKKALKSEIDDIIRPKPNSKILGMRFGLWAHHRGTKPNAKKLGKYLNKKFGEEPALMSQVNTENTISLINNRLENNGFFESKILASSKEKEHSGKWIYDVEVKEPYILENYVFITDSTKVAILIDSGMSRTRLKKGLRYELELFKQERERVDSLVKRQGYYNFQPDYLIFRVDTNQYEERKFDLYLSIKTNVPSSALIPYYIGDITVFSDYDQSLTSGLPTDTVSHDGMVFIETRRSIKPKVLAKSIHFREADLYNQRRQNLTSTRLSSIGNYKFVNVRYRPQDLDTSIVNTHGILEANIFLSPLKKRTLRAEFQLLSKSNNFVGPVFQLNYKNRNLFKGGEVIEVSGKIGFETQIASGRQTGLNSFETGLSTSILFPRFIAPFRVPLNHAYALPTTKMGVGFTTVNRVSFFRFNSILASYGYTWNTSWRMSHEINPISLNFVTLSHTSESFDSILNANPLLRRSFAQQFILGLTYSVQYNELLRRNRRNRFFILFNTDLSGNVIGGIQNAFNGPNVEKKIFGQPYAQYGKFDIDIRHYTSIGTQSQWIMRAFAGVGLPYGNSFSLPFAKQYFSAGPNSVRAFRIRSLGPGTYRPEVLDVASFFDQAGDIKFEANLEYRFPIVGILKGALFADAGNIWLLRENEKLPGSKFTSKWFSELAVGTGFGLRLDVGFFILRFDVSTPLRKPFLPEGDRWLRTFDFGQKDWRRENIIYMIAIGYPF